MEVKSAEFVASYPKVVACPKDGRPEFAFIGRSNVGKSSLINMLTHKGLAKVSGTPGKTRLLNFFLINQSWYLVDLPGYGYARVSKSEQRNLQGMISSYFQYREELINAFVLIDSTIAPTKIDLDFINGLGELAVPFVIVFTKTDRIGKDTLDRNIAAFMGKLSETWETLPTYFISSAEKRIGRTELLEYIAKWSKPSKQ
ncbi:MAG: YihA family ribosome biogenesis GTP-binding protein [Saprospiraceae bacterium]|nr:YihA family ribosome biogenesis GTP-binding protein [Saprospiraceae bacterium]